MLAFGFLILLVGSLSGFVQAPSPNQQITREIYRELLEIDTVTSTGDTARAAEAVAARLRTADFSGSDVQVFKPAPRKGNLVARLRSTGNAQADPVAGPSRRRRGHAGGLVLRQAL